jgi:hypothetical protein
LIAQERLVAHIRQACDAAQSSLAEHQEAHGCSRVAAGETAEHREPARR